MKTKKLRRALSVIIAAVMVFAMVPVMAMAEDDKPTLTITAIDQTCYYTGDVQDPGDAVYDVQEEIAEKIKVVGLAEIAPKAAPAAAAEPEKSAGEEKAAPEEEQKEPEKEAPKETKKEVFYAIVLAAFGNIDAAKAYQSGIKEDTYIFTSDGKFEVRYGRYASKEEAQADINNFSWKDAEIVTIEE